MSKAYMLLNVGFCSMAFLSIYDFLEGFLPRNACSAKRSIAIVSRPSVRLSVCDVDVPWAYVFG